MLSRFLPFLLAAVLAVHALYGVAGDVIVMCLGGGHHHGPSESEHCENVCPHDASWVEPFSPESHEDECSCTDIELSLVDLVTRSLSERETEIPESVPQASVPHACVTGFERFIASRSIQLPPVDVGNAHRLAIVASVRLTT